MKNNAFECCHVELKVFSQTPRQEQANKTNYVRITLALSHLPFVSTLYYLAPSEKYSDKQ